MQNKTTRKKFILSVLGGLVLLGGVTFTLTKSGYLQGSFHPGTFGPSGSYVGMQGNQNPGDLAENSAFFIEGYAKDAKTAKEDAKTAAMNGDTAALATAVSSAQKAFDSAKTAYANIATYISSAQSESDKAAKALTNGTTNESAAKAAVAKAETDYETKISKASGSDWQGAFKAKDAYKSCTDKNGTYGCIFEKGTYLDAKWKICKAYYGVNYPAKCGMISNMYNPSSDFEKIFNTAKSLYETWQAAQTKYATDYPSNYLSDLQSTALQKADDLARAKAADTAAAKDLASTESYATDAAKYKVLICTSLVAGPSSYEMTATDTEATFKFTVTIDTGTEASKTKLDWSKTTPANNGLNSLLALNFNVKDTANSLDTIIGNNTYEYWKGTLVVESHSQAGKLSYDGKTDTRFEIDLSKADALEFSFSGGKSGDSIDAYIDGEERTCSTTITITQASKGTSTPTDTDGDGLPDAKEVKLGTNPKLADTDGDGVSDGDEVKAGTDPLKAPETKPDKGGLDGDGDGLTNDEEKKLGTKATDSDTDDDGISDGEESKTYSTNPLLADSDLDGVNDYNEIKTYHTDPKDSDTDNDTYSDGVEVTGKTDPLDASQYPGSKTTTITTTTPTTDNTKVPTLTRDIILSDYNCVDSFTDTAGQWYDDLVCRAEKAGWVKGYSTLIFGPNGNITRAEYVKVLTKIFGLDENDGYKGITAFKDVHSTDWYFPYVNLAEDADWIRTRDFGYNFNPNTPITRADAILWTIRAADQTTYKFDVEKKFSDVENDDYYAYALSIASAKLVDTADEKNQPIVEGYSNGTFGPYKNIARSEAMAIATRAAIAWGVASKDWKD